MPILDFLSSTGIGKGIEGEEKEEEENNRLDEWDLNRLEDEE